MNWQKLKKDFLAGFIVSLIALPLCLGLAIASNVPATAGIISAVVGGLIVGFLGGSHVSITGPGNGLVVVILTSVAALGAGDIFAGYLYTLAAVVVSGGILFSLGLLRFGKLGDFFPSSAVQGMLSAIGIIILGKQAHIMFGNLKPEAANNMEMLYTIPVSVTELFSHPERIAPAAVGVLSLLIVFFYPKLRNKLIQLIPAPMWVLILCVVFYEYFSFTNPANYPVDRKYLLDLPEDMSTALVFPDFAKIATGAFWEAVIGITLIASIESLLSIKAIDRLDPQARRSNVNKDLKALGLATSLSGLLGGLPVVTVIARSSVNVNSGAQSRASNMFHALFIFIMLVGLAGLLKKIPLPALSAILVYTGYKLAEPAVFRKMWQQGKEQFAIFLATVVATLYLGLINGILIGIGLTLLIQMVRIRPLRLFFRYLLWPNTLMYEEEKNQFVLNVKGVANFINWPRLKYKLESLPKGSKLILDLSLTSYIDASASEQIAVFEDEMERRGGKLEVIGVDHLEQSTKTTLTNSSRIKAGKVLAISQQDLSKRQEKMKRIAEDLGWSFKTRPIFQLVSLERFPYFKTRRIDFAYNTLWGNFKGVKVKMRDVEYYEGEFIAKEVIRSTMVLLEFDKSFPTFSLERESFLTRFVNLDHLTHITLEGYEDFNKGFALRTNEKEAVEQFFCKELIHFFEFHPYYHVEANGNSLLIFQRERLATPSEAKQMLQFGLDLAEIVKGLN